MPLLTCTTKVDCPKEGKEVSVKQCCAECDDLGPVSYRGLTVLIYCRFDEVKPPTR